MLVAAAVERRDHVVGEATGLFENGRRPDRAEIAVEAFRHGAVEPGHVPHGEDDVVNRRAIGHRCILSDARLLR